MRYASLGQRIFMKLLKLHTVLMLLCLVSCANVDQVNRGRLSSRIMQANPSPEESTFLEETNSYREGSLGGSNSVGGGCGCN